MYNCNSIEDYPTLMQALVDNPSLLSNFELSTTERTTTFIDMFKACYNTKRLCTTDVNLFKQYITDTFNKFYKLYEDKLNVYERELNGDNGETVTRTLLDIGSKSNSVTTNTNSSQDASNTYTDYDIPRSSTIGNPTTKKTESIDIDTTGFAGTVETGSNNKNITENINGNVNVVKQRELWLKFVQNLYLKFADEFKDCFLRVYF